MKPPRQKTINARNRTTNNFNSKPRAADDDTNLVEISLAPLSPSDSEGDSDMPLMKRRRAQMNKSTMQDDEVMFTGYADWVQANRRLTPGTSAQKGSILSSTHVEPISRKPLAISVMNIAQDRLKTYAGPNTKELEKRYLQWQDGGKQHDKFCLICLLANTELGCLTCRRVYHALCLKPALTDGHTNGSFFCPLCIKRTWSEILPSPDSDPEDRLLVLASHLQNVGAMTWIQWRDTGNVANDQDLLYKMGVTTKQDTTSQAKTADFAPETKQEYLKEEYIEVQSPDKQPSEDPLNNGDLECIRCVCGQYNFADEGRRAMIRCDECIVWQHNHCIGLAADHNPDQYFCERCKPQDHQELLGAVSRGEKPWELVSRQGAGQQKEESVVLDPDADLATHQSVKPLQGIPPLASEVDHAFTSRSLSQNRIQEHIRVPNLRRSRAWLAKQPREGIKRKRNSPHNDSDGILRGNDAITALRQADSAATRDMYRSVSAHTQEHPEPSLETPTRQASSTQTLAERILGPLVTAPAVLPLIEEFPHLDEEHLQKPRELCQSNPEIVQDQRASEQVLQSLRAGASPDIGTPGRNSGIPESPIQSATEEDPSTKWQFYQQPNTRTPSTRRLPTVSQRPLMLPRPHLARAGLNSLQRPCQALASQEHMPAVTRRTIPSHTKPNNSPFSFPPPTRPPRTSIWDLPTPSEDATTSSLLATAILGPTLASQPAIQKLTHHRNASTRSFWDAVQGAIDQCPEAATDHALLRRKLHDEMPWLFPALTTNAMPADPASRNTRHNLTVSASPSQAQNLNSSPFCMPTSRPIRFNQAHLPGPPTESLSLPPAHSLALPSLSAPTAPPLTTIALSRRLSAQPAISTLLDTYSPLSETTIEVIKRLERHKILAFEYKFLMRQLCDALPGEWPKKQEGKAGVDDDRHAD